jgi:hypothetical protein
MASYARATDRSTAIEPTRFPLVAEVPICVEPCRAQYDLWKALTW